jgi:hypothetical protein
MWIMAVFRYGSSHYISFQEEIVTDIEQIVSGDYKGSQLLRLLPYCL